MKLARQTEEWGQEPWRNIEHRWGTLIRDDVVANTNFYLGAVRADNVLAALLALLNYNVTNPMFGLHAFETDHVKRVPFYGNKDYVHGPMADVLISDRMEF